MHAIRNLVRTNAHLTKNVAQQRNMSALPVPARNKVTKGEVIILAGAMVVGWVSTPIYVLLHMKQYRDKE